MGTNKKTNTGFTIVEVIIVLAVSAALALMGLLLVGGRQNSTQFQVAANDMQQQLQQIINETVNGYYPNNGNITCTGNSASSTPAGGPFFATGTAGQGTNTGCIFLGKIIQLGGDGGASQIPKDSLVLFPVVGNQYASTSSTQLTTSLQVAQPTALYPANVLAQPNYNYPNTAVTYQRYENGLTVSTNPASPYQGGFRDTSGVCNAPACPAGSLAILAGDSTGNIASYGDAGLNNGSQAFSLWTVNQPASPDPVLNTNPRVVAGDVYYSNLVSVKGVTLCMNSGSTNQSVLYTIGAGNNGSLGVSMKVSYKTDCLP